MEFWNMIITVITSVIASSGFWAFIQTRYNKNCLQSDMLIGLAHDRIIYLGLKYIERGWITKDEYENIHDYLFTPYEKLGGNGSAHRIISEVKRLPIKVVPIQERGGII